MGWEENMGESIKGFMHVTLVTIWNAAVGVLGVAVLQSAFMGVGLILADLPLAAVWTIVNYLMDYLFTG